MKRCPTCQSEYAEEHRFCIDDGTELIVIEKLDTQPVNEPLMNETRQDVSGPSVRSRPSNRWTVVLVVAIVAVAALLIAWIVTGSSAASGNERGTRNQTAQQFINDQAVSPRSSEDQTNMGSDVQLSSEDWRELNVFFSNFAEAGIYPFELGHVPNETLVRFGVWHNIINRQRFFEPDPNHSGNVRVPASRIAESIEKYFGITEVLHHSVEDVSFAAGYYSMIIGDGEIWPFAHVVELRSLGVTEYQAQVQNYWMPDYDVDKYGTTEEDWRRMGYDFDRDERIRARIRRVNEDGSERYILLEYVLAD